MTVSRAAAAGLDVPVEPGRDEARRAAREELTDPIYQRAEPSLVERVLGWLSERVGELFAALGGAPGGVVGVVLLVVALVALGVAVRARVRPTTRARWRARGAVGDADERTADEHRTAARAAATRGAFDEAVREHMRAVVRTLEEWGVLADRPGRTADEAAREAGARLPGLADALAGAAVVFDEVHYGGRPATRAEVDRVDALDADVRAALPARARER